MKRIHYVSGSRADFGLMAKTLRLLSSQEDIELGVALTGQHLLEKYASTQSDISAAGLNVICKVPVELTGNDGYEMGVAMALQMHGFLNYWQENVKPDLVLVLGDRGEMLAAALAAVHLGIHVVHLHGGERSGTLDESFRHAITKLAHYHFVATQDAKQRILSMGEDDDSITVVGAPGLVGILEGVESDDAYSPDTFGLASDTKMAVMIFHPVVQEAESAESQVAIIFDALIKSRYQILALRPNSDAGGKAVDAFYDSVADSDHITVIDHLDRKKFLMTLANADLLIGNSSSGIIESASLGIPCVNVGRRQSGRLRNTNTIDAEFEEQSLVNAIAKAEKFLGPYDNLYGDGSADEKILAQISQLDLSGSRLQKLNAY